MSASNPTSEADKQVHDIFHKLNDPETKEIKRLAKNKEKRVEAVKNDLGL